MYEAEEISQTRQEFSLVCQTDIVFADPGDDVVLACRLEPAISAAAMEIKWLNKADLVCHYKDGQVTESRGYEGRVSLSLQDLQRGNVSLTLRDIRGLQRGLYICEVIHEWQTKREYVFLYISSENVRLVVPTDIISADAGADVTLPVHLSPETSAVSMTVMWFRGTELIYQYNNGQGTTNRCCENRVGLPIQELGRGNLSLNLRNVQQSDSGNYTCKVFQDGYLFTGLVHLRVRVLEPTSRRTDSMERIPPFLGDGSSVESLEIEDTSVVGPTSRRTNSMEGIPPLMERESGNQNTRQTRERGIATEQARSFPAMPSVQRTSARENTLTQERPEATMQWTLPERRQGSIATAQETSTPAMPSQDPQREGTAGSAMSPAGGRTQAQERPGSSTQRTQRRHESTENKCQIL
ncbi:junctional adhesion molecule-like isoform X2 [Myxocyprinus asiaticus]|uniref:junctional adhesion molecule-like isoform X2 n=1 Tax=Myxocyprinus asiaticus TaxID=70543 RepID=UPI0022234FCA|nr:junctional adhesion molecule-like isoform X2 [Myxocyprinus asiaticus]